MSEHVFLSYCHEDRERVSELRRALMDAGYQVWWDQDILPGQDWRREIKRALKNAHALVACFSESTAKRYRSGIFPELRDAIGIYRELAPGRTFIIPVRLDSCAIPDLDIDSTRDLTDLQYLDLFPASAWSDGISALVRSLERTRGRP